MGHYGIVYIARNDKHPPNVYKVGGSSRDVDERMRELSNETATYGTFVSKASFPVTDWEAAESSWHRQLNEYRDDKEFFKAPYNELVEVVRNVCDDYQPERNVEQPTDGMSKALFLKQALPIPTQFDRAYERALAEQKKAYPARKLAEQLAQIDANRLGFELGDQEAKKRQSEEENWFFASVWPLAGIVLVFVVISFLLGFT